MDSSVAFFCGGVSSDPEVDSCPALREWSVGTVDASVARGGSTWKVDITSRPCVRLAQVRCLCPLGNTGLLDLLGDDFRCLPAVTGLVTVSPGEYRVMDLSGR